MACTGPRRGIVRDSFRRRVGRRHGHSDANRPVTDGAHGPAGRNHVCDAVLAYRGGAAFPAAGSRDADGAIESGPYRLIALSLAVDHAAAIGRDLYERVPADGKRRAYLAT